MQVFVIHYLILNSLLAMNRLSVESSHLLRQPIINETSRQSLRQRENNSCSKSCKHVCLPSKAAILMIFWTVAVGAAYNFVLLVAAALTYELPLSSDIGNIISANHCLCHTGICYYVLCTEWVYCWCLLWVTKVVVIVCGRFVLCTYFCD